MGKLGRHAAILLCGAFALAAGSCAPPPASVTDLPAHRPPPLVAGEPAPAESHSRIVPAPSSQPDAPAEWLVPPGLRPWRHIVIHHSATEGGNAERFDTYHRSKGWDELGYHFVIDNGRGGRDGRIEVGSRWRRQKWGSHTGGTDNNEFNNHGIGVCLVGEFDEHLPSAAQLASLKRLCLHLMRTFSIPPENVLGHRDAPNQTTTCPGTALHRYLHTRLRRELRRQLPGPPRQ